MKLLALIVAGIMLTGCSATKLDPMVADKIEMARAQQREACEARKSAQTEAQSKMAAGLSKEAQMEFVRSLGTAMVVQAATGNQDACGAGGANAYDVQIAEVKAKNEAVAKVVPGIVTGTVAGLGIVTTGDVLKTAFKNSGTQTTTNITGNENSTNHEHVQTTSNVDNNVSADGEGASTGVTNGNVTGPDQSSTTETIHEAPAVPVVEE